jgi:hypothetical protein
MIRSFRFPLALIASLSMACVSTPQDESKVAAEAPEQVSVGQPGSHVSVHGMNLFGSKSGKLYLSHIPLYSSPHNIQVIVEVGIVSGVPEASQAFATKNFTVRPDRFSLFDLAAGTLRSIKGTVFLGNFESGGRPIHNGVQFEVKRVIYQSGLLPTTPRNPALDYIAMGTPTEPFLVHVIDAAPNFDHIVAVKLNEGSSLDAAALEQGTRVTISGATNDVRQRLAPADVVSAIALPAKGVTLPEGGASTSSVQVTAELSCLPGGDFFGTCPAAL